MKILSLILIAFLLTGCVGSPIKRTFPEAPKELLEKCPELSIVPQTDRFSVVLETVTENYSKYNECSVKVDAWIEWHKNQKKIFNEVKI